MIAKLRALVPHGGRPYCEPFCGGASLFFARDPSPVEVLNDTSGDVVNLFRCLQQRATCEELACRVQATLYARREFEKALQVMRRDWSCSHEPDVERAWAFYVTQNQGMSGVPPTCAGNWSRVITHSRKGRASTTSSWIARQSLFGEWHDRLMRVQIDCRNALDVLRYYDNQDAVFYCDPPYLPNTRKETRVYACEGDETFHKRLVEVLLQLKGACVLSGYDDPLYQPLLDAGWSVKTFHTVCHAAVRTRNSGLQGDGASLAKVPRVECVWRNPRAAELTSGEITLWKA
jgi:DNA adenine methylase